MYVADHKNQAFLGFKQTVPTGHTPADFSVPGGNLAFPGIFVQSLYYGYILTHLNSKAVFI